MKPSKGVSATFAFAALVATSHSARADMNGDYDFERSRHTRYSSPQNFALELRFGPYSPAVDSKFPTTKPYETVFGTGKSLYVGAELDWQALRIPYLGTFGPGLGLGHTSKSAPAALSRTSPSSAPRQYSEESTYLSITPMYLVGVLRVDVLPRAMSIPLVGYAKAGLGYALWSTGNDAGVSTRDGVAGRGRSWGPHLALGASLLLDVFDRTAARDLDNSLGINHSYVFAEWMRSDVGTLSFFESRPQLRVGTSTWVVGLAFEM